MRFSTSNRFNHDGFTLVEMMIATALMGVVFFGLMDALNMMTKATVQSGNSTDHYSEGSIVEKFLVVMSSKALTGNLWVSAPGATAMGFGWFGGGGKGGGFFLAQNRHLDYDPSGGNVHYTWSPTPTPDPDDIVAMIQPDPSAGVLTLDTVASLDHAYHLNPTDTTTVFNIALPNPDFAKYQAGDIVGMATTSGIQFFKIASISSNQIVADWTLMGSLSFIVGPTATNMPDRYIMPGTTLFRVQLVVAGVTSDQKFLILTVNPATTFVTRFEKGREAILSFHVVDPFDNVPTGFVNGFLSFPSKATGYSLEIQSARPTTTSVPGTSKVITRL